MTPSTRIALCLASVLPMAGCSMTQATGRMPGELAVRLPIAGGDSVTIPFTKDGAVHAENDQYRVEKAMLQLNGATQQWVYDFVLQPKTSEPVRHVHVDDVTDNEAVPLVDDSLSGSAARWEKRSAPFSLSETSTAWIYNQDNTIRVYRFIVEDATGHTSTLYEAFAYPLFVKASILGGAWSSGDRAAVSR